MDTLSGWRRELIMNGKITKSLFKIILIYIFLTILGFIMIYPLIWLFFSSFKPNNEIFGSLDLFPKQIIWDSYLNGWKGNVQFSFSIFFLNSLKLVTPVVLFTLISSTLVAYGFARFKFPLKKILFAVFSGPDKISLSEYLPRKTTSAISFPLLKTFYYFFKTKLVFQDILNKKIFPEPFIILYSVF